VFADVLMTDPPSNYDYIGNWFMTTDNIYQHYNWAKTLLSELNDSNEKPYMFDALLGMERQNKNEVYRCYVNSLFRDSIFLTYHKGNIDRSTWHESYRIEYYHDASQDDSIMSWAMWTDMSCENLEDPGATVTVPTQNLVPVKIFNSCYYSIVAEGFFDSIGARFTEKTAKAMLGKRLMVYFGGHRDLAKLRALGFQTWNGIIDESYDEIENDHLRWRAAWQQVEFLCRQDPQKILNKSRRILDHNQQWFLDRDWFAALRKHLDYTINSSSL
jgi:hypothetical protein